MITPDMIPDEVADEVKHCFHTRGAAKVTIAAALNAWPDMQFGITGWPKKNGTSLILPLETRAAGVFPPQKEQPNED